VSELFDPSAIQEPRRYIARLWWLRHYIFAEASGRVRASHSELALGRVWLFLEPVLYVSVYFVLFGVFLDTGRGLSSTDFLSYLVVGRLSFQVIRRGVIGGSGSLLRKRAVPTNFPRAVIPLSHLARSVLTYRYEAIVMLVLVAVRGTRPTISWLWVPPLALLMVSFMTGATLILARIVNRFPDLHATTNHLMRLVFYSSGALFPIEIYLAEQFDGPATTIYTMVNPIFAFVKLHQRVVLGYDAVRIEYLLASTGIWSLVLLVGGFLWFVNGERHYQDVIDRR